MRLIFTKIGLFLSCACLLSASEESGSSLTVYNQNFAVVRDSVPLSLDEGLQEVSYSGVTSQLEPESVVLRDASGKVDLQVVEQSYRGDPVNQERLLQMFEGKEITFVRKLDSWEAMINGKVVRAPVQSSSGYLEPIIEVNGELLMHLPGEPRFPSLGDESILQPTLSWKIFSKEPVDLTADLSYLTQGLSWEADYNFVLPESGDDVSVSGWVSVRNQSGKNFQNSKVKLVAGNVNRVTYQSKNRHSDALMARSMSMQAAPAVEQKKFDDFHLYSLPGQIDLRDQETKQLEFIRADAVQTTKQYVYNGSSVYPYAWSGGKPILEPSYGTQSNREIVIYRSFENTEENQLGVPLPAGTLRFYRADSDGQVEFVGENTIDHTPKDETVTVYLGDAFDLVGERTQTKYFRHATQNLARESFDIEIRNRGEEMAEVDIIETLYRWGNWKIIASSDDYEDVDAQTVSFVVEVDGESVKTVSYTVEYTW